MSWKSQYVPEQAMVTVANSGAVRNEDAKAQLVEAVRLLKEHSATGVLIDCSQAVWEMSLPELYWLPEQAAELNMPWDVRMAVLLPSPNHQIALYQFLELVCHNAGYALKLFEHKAEAEAWLTPPHPALSQEGKPSLGRVAQVL
jgi:hypothetical protein